MKRNVLSMTVCALGIMMGAGAFSAQAQTEQAAGSERTKMEMKTADLVWNCYGWYTEICENSDPEVKNKCLELLKNETPFFLVSCEIKNNTAKTLAPAFVIHLYDADGKDVMAGGYPARPGDRVLLPNGKVYMTQMIQSADTDKIRKIGMDFEKAATFDLQAQLETANVNVQYDDFGATVTGALKNTGSSACARPSVQIVSYRGESLLGTEDLPLDATQELAAGQSVEFSVQAMPPAAQESFKQAGVTNVEVIGACGLQD